MRELPQRPVCRQPKHGGHGNSIGELRTTSVPTRLRSTSQAYCGVEDLHRLQSKCAVPPAFGLHRALDMSLLVPLASCVARVRIADSVVLLTLVTRSLCSTI